MKFFKKLLIFLLFFTFVNKPAFAAGDGKFAVSYDIKYNVAGTGITTVNQTISLKNLTSNFYATEYTSKIQDEKITNIRGFDNLGPLKTEITGQNLKVLFNDKIFGLNKTYQWSLVYETPGIAKKQGRIWEIILPKPSDTEEIENYIITLNVPKEFGQPAYLKPLPKINYVWHKDEIQTSGIFAAFGDFQNYNFRLTYNLENKNVIPVRTEIALPPTTAYQEVYLQSLEPKPEDVLIDQDGNWLAQYNLNPREHKTVILTGTALVYFEPRYKEKITNLIDLIASKNYWDTSEPEILDIAVKYKTSKELYDFVVSKLSYDVTKIDRDIVRMGAKNALLSPKTAICMEFTDLFITLARTNKIPARELEGYALTTNEKRQPVALKRDILHAWPQYWNGINWISIDPTWGNTTGGIDYFNQFDFNHLVFAIHGLDSSYPAPAGAYKGLSDTKDVLVSFGVDKPTADELLDLNLIGTNLIIYNKGQALVRIKNTNLDLGFDQIPPFAKRVVPLKGQGIIEVKINDQTKTFTITHQNYLPAIFAIAAIITVGLLVITKKSGHLSLFRRQK